MAYKAKGGNRKNSGRKKVKDKKKPVTLYIRPSKIKENGGEDNLKQSCYDHLGIVE